MGELRDLVAASSEKLGIPPEILTALPVVELTGDAAVSIEQHRGVTAYSEEEIRVRVNLGVLRITGSGLTIRTMNAARIVIEGRITGVLPERSRP